MKLLYCTQCGDVFALLWVERQCTCGKVRGRYLDHHNAEYSGDTAVPLGFSNPSFRLALKQQPLRGLGKGFHAFVVPEECATFRKVPCGT